MTLACTKKFQSISSTITGRRPDRCRYRWNTGRRPDRCRTDGNGGRVGSGWDMDDFGLRGEHLFAQGGGREVPDWGYAVGAEDWDCIWSASSGGVERWPGFPYWDYSGTDSGGLLGTGCQLQFDWNQFAGGTGLHDGYSPK